MSETELERGTSAVFGRASDVLIHDAEKDAAVDSADAENATSRGGGGGISGESSAALASRSQMHATAKKHVSATATPGQVKGLEGKKEGHVASHSSKQLAGSNKLEDQINLQHLVELMKIFYVSELA